MIVCVCKKCKKEYKQVTDCCPTCGEKTHIKEKADPLSVGVIEAAAEIVEVLIDVIT